MANNLLDQDHLALGPIIVARLAEALPDKPVELCERVDQVLAADMRPEVVMVMWAGDRYPTAQRAAWSAASMLYQTWLVVHGINHNGPVGAVRGERAGPVMARIRKALAGWKPEGLIHTFGITNSPMGPSLTDKKAVFPMAFDIQLAL